MLVTDSFFIHILLGEINLMPFLSLTKRSGTLHQCKRHAKLKIADLSMLETVRLNLFHCATEKSGNFFPDSKHF
jgi:hypothetical protein